MLLQLQHLYDISVIALAWLNQARDDPTYPRPRSIPPILYTLQDLGLITPGQVKGALKDLRLRRQLQAHLALLAPNHELSRDEALRVQLAGTTSHLILRLPEGVSFNPTNLLGRSSYQFFVSARGLAYAQSKEGPYGSIVTQAAFIPAWEEMRRLGQRIGASLRARDKHRHEDPKEDT